MAIFDAPFRRYRLHRERPNRVLGPVSVLVVGTLLLSSLSLACSVSKPAADGLRAEPGAASEDRAPDRLAAGVDDPGPRLRLALMRPMSHRPDEVVLTDQSAVIVADLVYDGLTEAVGSEGRLRPGLAESWTANEDFTVWTFRLAADGAVSAATVVATLEVFMNARTDRRGAVSAVLAADLEAVWAEDDRTVVVELNAPNAGLPWVLSGVPFSIIGADGQATGDYEVTTEDANGMILQLRASAATAGSSPSPGAEQSPNEIVITWSENEAAAGRLLSDGRVDMAVVQSATRTGVESNARFTRYTTTAATRFYVLDSRSRSLSDPETRRLVLAAIDRAELLAQPSVGNVADIDGLLGSGMAGYRVSACGAVCDDLANRSEATGEPTATVADSSDPTEEPLRVQIAYSGDEQRGTAAVIARQLTAAGIEAEQSELQPEQLARVIVQGETDMFAFGWVAAGTSSDAVLPPLLAVDSPANVARIARPAVEDLLNRAALTADDQQRWDLLHQAHRAALDEALILPVAGSTSTLAVASGARPVAVRADGSIDLETGS